MKICERDKVEWVFIVCFKFSFGGVIFIFFFLEFGYCRLCRDCFKSIRWKLCFIIQGCGFFEWINGVFEGFG